MTRKNSKFHSLLLLINLMYILKIAFLRFQHNLLIYPLNSHLFEFLSSFRDLKNHVLDNFHMYKLCHLQQFQHDHTMDFRLRDNIPLVQKYLLNPCNISDYYDSKYKDSNSADRRFHPSNCLL